MLSLQASAELEMRRRKRAGITLSAPARWDDWLRVLFPKHFTQPFAQRHADLWQWVEAIQPGIRPRPFCGFWSRGGAKSTNAEAAVVKIGAKKVRKYGWYLSSTQDKADQHIDSISGMLESSETNKYYPELSDRAVNKFGQSKGWRRERLRTASGFTVDALGLDTGARGGRIEESRPDFICIDDVDELHDSFATTQKKIKTLTQTILPAGSADCAVLFIQNIIHPDSIAARLVDGRADFLMDRIISGPYPAIDNMEYEQVEGKYIITGGVPTWAGQSLEICQGQILSWGFSAFMQEAQHRTDKTGGIWDEIDFQHIHYQDLPDFERTTVWVDPAVSSTDESDSMGISAGGIIGNIVVIGLYFWEAITTPEDALERAIMKAIEFKSLTVGVETDQGGDTWRSVYARALEAVKEKLKKELPPVQYESIRWPDFVSVKAGGTDEGTGHAFGSKTERNSKLLAFYENGLVKHLIGTHAAIESSLRRFPRKPLDLADSWFWCHHDLVRGKIDWGSTEDLGQVKGYRSQWE